MVGMIVINSLENSECNKEAIEAWWSYEEVINILCESIKPRNLQSDFKYKHQTNQLQKLLSGNWLASPTRRKQLSWWANDGSDRPITLSIISLTIKILPSQALYKRSSVVEWTVCVVTFLVHIVLSEIMWFTFLT